jgi:hypothetical protein
MQNGLSVNKLTWGFYGYIQHTERKVKASVINLKHVKRVDLVIELLTCKQNPFNILPLTLVFKQQ